jgi:hypothetical protein
VFTLVKLLPIKQLLAEQVPAITASFVIAEVFYKFHSFTLECLAFLVTWSVLDGAINLVSRRGDSFTKSLDLGEN